MAFLNRLGNLLKHNASKHVTSVSSASNPSLFQAIRSLSTSASTKLFIGGLSYTTDEQSLTEAFSKYGEVVEARIIMDRESGRSRGFGFVTFTSTEYASSAIQAFDGQELHGRTVRVNFATERPRAGNFGGGYGGGGYGGGGYGGGGYGGQDGNYGPGRYQGGGYSGGDGNYSGGGGGYGGGNQHTGGGGGGYDGGDSVQGGGGNYSDSKPNFASLLNDGMSGAVGGNQEPPLGGGGAEGGIEAGNGNFGQDMDENIRDEDDYANTRS